MAETKNAGKKENKNTNKRTTPLKGKTAFLNEYEKLPLVLCVGVCE